MTSNQSSQSGEMTSLKSFYHWKYLLAFGCLTGLFCHIPAWYAIYNIREDAIPIVSEYLKEGWFFGMWRDDYDAQWGSIRKALPSLFGLCLFHTFLMRAIFGNSSYQTRKRVDLIVSIIFTFLLHGVYILHVFAIIAIAFAISRLALSDVTRKYAIPIIWIFTIGIFVVCDFSNNLSLEWLLGDSKLVKGMFAWHTCYRLLSLRLVSFVCDFVWSLSSEKFIPSEPIKQYEDKAVVMIMPPRKLNWSGNLPEHRESLSKIAHTSHPLEFYSFSNLCVYALYSPLYLAGPTLTFNCWLGLQVNLPSSKDEKKPFFKFSSLWKEYLYTVVPYGIRVFMNFLMLDIFTHMSHTNVWIAIDDPVKRDAIWSFMNPFTLMLLSVYTLLFKWLKFLFLWRFMRFWSISASGIYPPENMLRCILASVSVSRFWRSWHQSFNLWIIRYMFRPLMGDGKSGTLYKNFVGGFVFTYVALWHERRLFLVCWALLMFLGMVVETVCTDALWIPMMYKKVKQEIMHGDKKQIVTNIIPRQKNEASRVLTEVLECLGGTISVNFLIIGNLVGFTYQTEGLVRTIEIFNEKSYLDGHFTPYAWLSGIIGLSLMSLTASFVGRSRRAKSEWTDRF